MFDVSIDSCKPRPQYIPVRLFGVCGSKAVAFSLAIGPYIPANSTFMKWFPPMPLQDVYGVAVLSYQFHR